MTALERNLAQNGKDDGLLALLKRALAMADAQGLCEVGISLDHAINILEPQPVSFDQYGNECHGSIPPDLYN